MRVTVLPTAQAAEAYDLTGATAIVIDVLRATSVITMALARGARRVVTTTSPEQAFALRERLEKDETLLGGERNADKIEGFDLGNSPQDYTQARVANKTVILTTTNGTLALSNCSQASQIYVASMLNCRATIEALLASDCQTVVVVCSGNNGLFTLEDSLCAGMIVNGLGDIAELADDFTIGVSMMAQAYEPNSVYCFRQAHHFNRLIDKGYSRDIEVSLCSADTQPVVCIARKATDINEIEVTL